MLKNWKSFVAFFLFIVVYGYTAFSGKGADVIWNTGLLAFLAMTLIMSRSDLGAELMKMVTEVIKKKME